MYVSLNRLQAIRPQGTIADPLNISSGLQSLIKLRKAKETIRNQKLHLGRLVCLLAAVKSVDPATPELEDAIPESGSEARKDFAFQ
ncbi:ALA-interacting subunit 1 [Senna tora]|uniref:ALA-interacting subunit 1 n=1 Tax=Senna tora TaxID=362788 RepID=A0A835CBK4_9FABA|nr:ALA-interacting subunit 1 [Senna tora]